MEGHFDCEGTATLLEMTHLLSLLVGQQYLDMHITKEFIEGIGWPLMAH